MLRVLNAVMSIVIMTVLFAMMFRLLPNAKVAWDDVWVGAGVTAVLFTVGKFLIGLYLGKAGISSAYGAASSLMVVLLWVYYSSLIFYFGAGSRTFMPASMETVQTLGMERTSAPSDIGPSIAMCLQAKVTSGCSRLLEPMPHRVTDPRAVEKYAVHTNNARELAKR